MSDEDKVGVIMIPWEIITGAGLFSGTSVGYLIASFATILACVLIAADEKRSKERERAERYRQRFQHEASREY